MAWVFTGHFLDNFASDRTVAGTGELQELPGKFALTAAWEAAPAAPGRRACRCEKPAQGAAAPKTRTPGSAAVVEGHLVAVGVREREGAAERPVDGR